VGRTGVREDLIAAAPVAGLSAALDYDTTRAGAGGELPALWHWLFFHETAPASCLGADGHPLRGDFLPPVALPRRMWAGGRLSFLAPLRVGDIARRESVIVAVDEKQGRSGALVFVRLAHRISQGGRLCIEEEQDLVYRGSGGNTPAAMEAPGSAQFARTVTPDPVLLFRYSALTFNSHRIHFDRDYATREEGYAGLVVQGPLTATLLLDLLQRERPDAVPRRFEFRGLRPLTDGGPLSLQGRSDAGHCDLWALDGEGALAMQARAELAT